MAGCDLGKEDAGRSSGEAVVGEPSRGAIASMQAAPALGVEFVRECGLASHGRSHEVACCLACFRNVDANRSFKQRGKGCPCATGLGYQRQGNKQFI